jgi:hypothetical protein
MALSRAVKEFRSKGTSGGLGTGVEKQVSQERRSFALLWKTTYYRSRLVGDV